MCTCNQFSTCVQQYLILYLYIAEIIASRHFKITVFVSQLYFTNCSKVYNDILLLIMLYNNKCCTKYS